MRNFSFAAKNPLLLCSLMLAMCITAAFASPGAEKAACKRMLDAIADDNFPQFVAGGTLDFMKTDKVIFDKVVRELGPKIAMGYKLDYTGPGEKDGQSCTLWKVKLNGVSQPLTATLMMSRDKVSGFWLE